MKKFNKFDDKFNIIGPQIKRIRKAEKIEASEEEIKEKLEEMAKNYGKKVEEIQDNEDLKNYIKEGIESEKAIDFIVKNAKIK